MLLDTDCKISAEKRQSSDGISALQTSAGSLIWLTAECLNRSLTCFANSFISQRRKFPGGTAMLYAFLANQGELVGISTVLSNLGVRHHIISEFMIGWEGKDSHIYYNLFNWIPNNLETHDMRSLEGKFLSALKNSVLVV